MSLFGQGKVFLSTKSRESIQFVHPGDVVSSSWWTCSAGSQKKNLYTLPTPIAFSLETKSRCTAKKRISLFDPVRRSRVWTTKWLPLRWVHFCCCYPVYWYFTWHYSHIITGSRGELFVLLLQLSSASANWAATHFGLQDRHACPSRGRQTRSQRSRFLPVGIESFCVSFS